MRRQKKLKCYWKRNRRSDSDSVLVLGKTANWEKLSKARAKKSLKKGGRLLLKMVEKHKMIKTLKNVAKECGHVLKVTGTRKKVKISKQ